MERNNQECQRGERPCASQDGSVGHVAIGVSASESTSLVRLMTGGELRKRVASVKP